MVDFVDHGFQIFHGAYISAEFSRNFCATARAQQRVHAKSEVWVEVFNFLVFPMISRCQLVIAVTLILMDDVAICSTCSLCVEQVICMWKK